MYKYENTNLYDTFSPFFKKKQINEIKKILLTSNSNNEEKKQSSSSKIEKGRQYFDISFIIDERTNDNEFYSKLIKMKLSLLILKNINNIFYINGIYKLNDNIIVTQQIQLEEILLRFGNKSQKDFVHEKSIENRILINKRNNEKYLGLKKLSKINNYIGCKVYNIYSITSDIKKDKYKRNRNKYIENDEYEEKEDKNHHMTFNEKKNICLMY